MKDIWRSDRWGEKVLLQAERVQVGHAKGILAGLIQPDWFLIPSICFDLGTIPTTMRTSMAVWFWGKEEGSV